MRRRVRTLPLPAAALVVAAAFPARRASAQTPVPAWAHVTYISGPTV